MEILQYLQSAIYDNKLYFLNKLKSHYNKIPTFKQQKVKKEHFKLEVQ